MSLITVDSIVKSAMIAEGQPNVNTLYARFLQFALNGVKEHSYDVYSTVKSKKLQIDTSNNTANFPEDMVYMSKIGVVKDERLILLGYSEDILVLDEWKKDDTKIKADIASGLNVFYNYYDYRAYDRNVRFSDYGIGGANSTLGYYRKNDELRRFEFDSGFQETEVIIEYISNGIECGGATTVDERSREALEEYIRYQYYRMRKDLPAWRVRDQKRTYLNAKRKYKSRMLVPTMKQIIDAARMGEYQAPK